MVEFSQRPNKKKAHRAPPYEYDVLAACEVVPYTGRRYPRRTKRFTQTLTTRVGVRDVTGVLDVYGYSYNSTLPIVDDIAKTDQTRGTVSDVDWLFPRTVIGRRATRRGRVPSDSSSVLRISTHQMRK